jgi:hypothetical protein
MTADQMKFEFDVGYDFITNYEGAGVEKKEISTFLTQAQEQIVLEAIAIGSTTELSKKILNRLKVPDTQTTAHAAGPYPNSYYRDLPANLLSVVNDRLDFTAGATHFYANKAFTDVKVIPVDDDYYHLNKDNPFKKPNEELAWRLDYAELDASVYERRHVYILGSDLTINNSHIHYYRKPEPIIVQDSTYNAGDGAIDGKNFSDYTAASLDSELDPLVHRKIVDGAVKLAFAAMKDEKGFQLSSAKEQ